MKKAISILSAMLLIVGIKTASAQGGMQRRTPEERLTQVKEKLAPLSLSADQTTKSDTVFLHYYKAQQKAFEGLMAGGGQPDRDAIRSTMQKLSATRDSSLQTIFSADQFTKWKNDIEPTTRPQRPAQQ